MADFFSPGMRLYLEKLVDWDSLLALRQGDDVDVEAEVGAYRTILETTASLAETFLRRDVVSPQVMGVMSEIVHRGLAPEGATE